MVYHKRNAFFAQNPGSPTVPPLLERKPQARAWLAGAAGQAGYTFNPPATVSANMLGSRLPSDSHPRRRVQPSRFVRVRAAGPLDCSDPVKASPIQGRGKSATAARICARHDGFTPADCVKAVHPERRREGTGSCNFECCSGSLYRCPQHGARVCNLQSAQI